MSQPEEHPAETPRPDAEQGHEAEKPIDEPAPAEEPPAEEPPSDEHPPEEPQPPLEPAEPGVYWCEQEDPGRHPVLGGLVQGENDFSHVTSEDEKMALAALVQAGVLEKREKASESGEAHATP